LQDERKPTRPIEEDPRRERRLLDAVARVAPGTPLRAGIDDIIRSHEGALIVVGHPEQLSFLYSGGIRLDQPFRPQLLFELAKMDGAIIVNEAITRLAYANVQLMPDPTIPSSETGTRHRTAERVAKQTGALVVSISQQRDVVTVSRCCEIEITSASVCFATRSAVRCRVPVSFDGIVGSGISCTFACASLVTDSLTMIAPSIFATS